MYLLRYDLVAGPRDSRFDPRNPHYSLHQVIWDSMDAPDGSKRPFLYRLELAHRPRAYVLSETEPAAEPKGWRVESMPFRPRLIDGMRLQIMGRFALRESLKRRPGEKRGKTLDAVTYYRREDESKTIPDIVQAWFTKRTDRLGFTMDAVTSAHYLDATIRRKGGEVKERFIDVEGIITIQDPEQAMTTIQDGIGACKAFGGGLVLVEGILN